MPGRPVAFVDGMFGVRATHGLAAALLAAAGCLYIDPINERPSAEIRREGSDLVHRNQDVAFRALVDDPDDDDLQLSWRGQACNGVAGDPGVVCAAVATGVDPVFGFTVPSRVEDRPTQQIYVDLDVADDQGARARPSQGLALAVSNRDPVPEVQVRGRELDGQFPVRAPITIAAVGHDDDGDLVALSWELFAAATSRPEDVVFAPGPPPASGGEEYTLVPDVDGAWTVRVTADDGTAQRTVDTAIQVRPDHAPCLGATDPAGAGAVVLALAPRRFAVLVVTDDLDVHPPPSPDDPVLGATGFTWSMRPAGAGPFTTIATGVAAVDFDPAAFAPGDRVELRVEIADRRDDRPNNCAPDAPTCSIEPPASCQQRRTWTVEAR